LPYCVARNINAGRPWTSVDNISCFVWARGLGGSTRHSRKRSALGLPPYCCLLLPLLLPGRACLSRCVAPACGRVLSTSAAAASGARRAAITRSVRRMCAAHQHGRYLTFAHAGGRLFSMTRLRAAGFRLDRWRRRTLARVTHFLPHHTHAFTTHLHAQFKLAGVPPRRFFCCAAKPNNGAVLPGGTSRRLALPSPLPARHFSPL